jgi:hypothetical protein
MCFSDLQPGDFGPRRMSEADIRSIFAKGWRVDALERTTFDTLMVPVLVQAWLARITKI